MLAIDPGRRIGFICPMLWRLAAIGLLVPGAAQADPMERYRQLTEVTVQHCARPGSTKDIQVCGRRDTNRWRLPLIELTSGDPRAETVSMERNRLTSAPRLKCGVGAILAGCGMVGVSVSTNGTTPPKFRTLAD